MKPVTHAAKVPIPAWGARSPACACSPLCGWTVRALRVTVLAGSSVRACRPVSVTDASFTFADVAAATATALRRAIGGVERIVGQLASYMVGWLRGLAPRLRCPSYAGADLPFALDPEARRALAAAVGRRAGTSPLVVQLAQSIPLGPEGLGPADESQLPTSVGETLDLHAARLGAAPQASIPTGAPYRQDYSKPHLGEWMRQVEAAQPGRYKAVSLFTELEPCGDRTVKSGANCSDYRRRRQESRQGGT